MLLAGVTTLSAQRTAAVRGVVRDAEGTPQMGVAVQLLRGDAQVVAAGFTDLNGRYLIRNLIPGMYQLRATATLSLPVMRSRLQLRAGDLPTINVTLSGLLGAPWLSISRRPGEDQPDDWRWTLRSSANRPLLRVFGEDVAGDPRTAERGTASPQVRRTVSVGQARGSFGNSGVRFAAQERRQTGDRAGLTVARAEVLQGDSGPVAVDFAAVFQGQTTPVAKRKAAMHLMSRPQVGLTGQSTGLLVLDASAGEQFTVGEFARVEAGSLLRVIRSGQTAMMSYPFLRVETATPGGWVAGYALATSADCQELSDLGRPLESVPAFGLVGGRLRPEQGLHQAIFVRRKAGKAVLQATLEHNVLRTVSLFGAGPNGSSFAEVKQRGGQQQTVGMRPARLVDSTNGSFRELHAGYTADAWHILVSYPWAASTNVSAEYVGGNGLTTRPRQNQAAAGDLLAREQAQALRVGVRTAIRRTGTQFAAGYTVQTRPLVTPISQFGSDRDGDYLSVHLRQALPAVRVLPGDTVLSVDASNLAGQGYVVLASADALSPALLASTLRSLQASLSFTF